MTYTIRIRSAGGVTVQSYVCPDHGEFDTTVARDAKGNPPPIHPCPDPDCRRPSPWRISAPAGRVSQMSFVRGKSDERPAGHVMLDTRPLADGMSRKEWDAKQAKITRDLTFKKAKAALE